MASESISQKLRWLVIVTGCLLVCGFLLGTDPISALFLTLGAAIQPCSRRAGKWLMWASALLTSIWTFTPFIADAKISGVMSLVRGPALMTSADLLLLALVLWCDVALVIDAAKQIRSSDSPVRSSAGSLDWIAWIAALLMSAWYFRGALIPLNSHGLDILVTNASLALVVFLLDIALIVDASRSRRTLRH